MKQDDWAWKKAESWVVRYVGIKAIRHLMIRDVAKLLRAERARARRIVRDERKKAMLIYMQLKRDGPRREALRQLARVGTYDGIIFKLMPRS